MPAVIRVPEIATGDTEAVLTEWLGTEGSAYDAEHALASVETAKAIVEITLEEAGTLLRMLVPAGTEVTVGQPIAVLAGPGEVVDDVEAALSELGLLEDAAPTTPAVDQTPEVEAPEPDVAASPAGAGSRPEGRDVAANGAADARLFSSPLARRIAREADLDLTAVVGSGPRGRIRRRDVEEALARRAAQETAHAAPTPSAPVPVTPVPDGAAYDEIPHTRLRRAIARRLTESVQQAPQFTVSGQACIDRLLELRRELQDVVPTKVSVTDLLVKAVAVAHLAVPEMNVVWTPDAVRRYRSVDVAVAVATETGLVTPVLRSVEHLSVVDIARRSVDLVERARSGRLQQAELEGGTISVSNLGMFGTREFTAIVNPPQASILAVGAATPEAVVRDGEVAVEQTLRVTLTADHRPVDGATAARWMQAFVHAVEHPLGLLVAP